MAVDAGNIRIVLSADTAQLATGLAAASRLIGGFGTTSGRQLGVLANVMSGITQAATKMNPALIAASAAAVGLGVGVTATIQSAIQFESAWAGVLKTLDGSETQLSGLQNELLRMTSKLPVAANDLAGIAEAAGQLGVRVKDVAKFTETIAMIGETTNMSVDEAATSLARFQNVMQLPRSSIEQVGSAIVELGNNFAATESEITNLSLRMASSANVVGISAPAVLGMAATMKELGLQTESAGTAWQKTVLTIEAAVQTGGTELENFAEVAGMSAEAFSKLWNEDADAGLVSFIEGLKKISDEGGNVVGMLDTLNLGNERTRNTLLALASGYDRMVEGISAAEAETANAVALQEEYAKRLDTTQAKLKLLGTQLKTLAIIIGTPVKNYLLDPLIDFANFQLEPIVEAAVRIKEAFESAGPLEFDPMARNPFGASGRDTQLAGSDWGDPARLQEIAGYDQVAKSAEEAARANWELEQSAAAAARGVELVKIAGDSWDLPDAASLGVELQEIDTAAEAASRSINTMYASLNKLNETLDSIEDRRDAFQQQTEALAAAEANVRQATEAYRAGEISVEEFADAYGELNRAQIQSGVSADEAVAGQRALVEQFVQLAAQGDITAAELDKVVAQYILLDDVEIKDLSVQGVESWAAAGEQIGQVRASLVEIDGTKAVAEIAAETGVSEAQITELIRLGDDWATGLYEAKMNAETSLARTAVQNLMNDFQAFSATEWRAVFDADPSGARKAFAEAMLMSGQWDQEEAIAYINADASQADAIFAASMMQLNMWDGYQVTSFLFAEADQSQIDAFGAALDEVPEEKLAEVLTQVSGMDDLYEAISLLAQINSKTIVVGMRVVSGRTGAVTNFSGLEETFVAQGGILHYAEGDVANAHAPEITSRGAPIRVWSEPETGGEAYIPLANDYRRPRAQSILRETARRLGMSQYAMGGLVDSFATGGASFESRVGLPKIAVTVTVNAESLGQAALDLAPAARALREVGDAADEAGTKWEQMHRIASSAAVGVQGDFTTMIAGIENSLDMDTSRFLEVFSEISGWASDSFVDWLGDWDGTVEQAVDKLAKSGLEMQHIWEGLADAAVVSASATGREMALALDPEIFIDKFSDISGWAENSFRAWLGEWDGTTKQMVQKLEEAGLELDFIWERIAQGAGDSSAEMYDMFKESSTGIIAEAIEMGQEMAEAMDPALFIAAFESISGVAVESIEGWADEWDGTVQGAVRILEDAGANMDKVWEEIFRAGADEAEVLMASIEGIANTLDEVEESADNASRALDVLYGHQLDMIDAQIDYLDAVDEVNEIINEGGVFGFTDSDARSNLETLIDAGQSMKDYGLEMAKNAETAEDAISVFRGLEGEFVRLAQAAGLPLPLILTLTESLFGLPDELLVDIQVNGDEFLGQIGEWEATMDRIDETTSTVLLELLADAAEAELSRIQTDIDQVTSEDYLIELRAERDRLNADIEEIEAMIGETTDEDHLITLTADKEGLEAELAGIEERLAQIADEEYLISLRSDQERLMEDLQEIAGRMTELTGEEYVVAVSLDGEAIQVDLQTLEETLASFETTEYIAVLGADDTEAITTIESARTTGTEFADDDYTAVLEADDQATPTISDVKGKATDFATDYTATLRANDQASSVIQTAAMALASFQDKSITVTTTQRTITEAATSAANGAIFFASGGVENHVAQIAPAGAWRVWAEPETGGEAYIPLAPGKRDRSMSILSEVASMFGRALVPMADGGIMFNRGSGGPVSVSAPINVTVSGGGSPVETARMTEEAANRAVDRMVDRLETVLSRR